MLFPLDISPQLYGRMDELEPLRFTPSKDTNLEANCEDFRTAILTQEKYDKERVIDPDVCAGLILGLLHAFTGVSDVLPDEL